MTHDYKTITLNNNEGVWTLMINRPESLNALNMTVLNEMGEALRFISEMEFADAKALIVTGSGQKAFVAGADIKEMSGLSGEDAVQFARRGQSVFHELELLEIPVVAAVNGFALGGGLELALSCDFIYASENAKVGLPEVSLGLIPGFGGTIKLARAVGLRKAREMIFSGDMVTASEALQMGLVNKVIPPSELLSAVQGRLESIISKGPVAVGMAKKSIQATWDMEIDEAFKFEAELFGDLFLTADTKEGLQAFVEKRKAQFKGE